MASYATPHTLGHEVGHVLGLPHCDLKGGPYLNNGL